MVEGGQVLCEELGLLLQLGSLQSVRSVARWCGFAAEWWHSGDQHGVRGLAAVAAFR